MKVTEEIIGAVQSEVDLFMDEKRIVKYADIYLIKKTTKRLLMITVEYIAVHKPTGIRGITPFEWRKDDPYSAIIECLNNVLNYKVQTGTYPYYNEEHRQLCKGLVSDLDSITKIVTCEKLIDKHETLH